jgi:uncharacterized protein
MQDQRLRRRQFLCESMSLAPTCLVATHGLPLALTWGVSMGVQAQQLAQMRIGAGSQTGTYLVIGNLIANYVSQPGKFIASLQADGNGTLSVLSAVASGALESGIASSDLLSWAYRGTSLFEGKAAQTELRLIANLYPKSVHIVARKGAGIKSIADLKGKRVATDESRSGTPPLTRLILAAHGIRESEVKPLPMPLNQAVELMKRSLLDALFFVGETPAPAITDLATSSPGIELLPLVGAPADRLRASQPFLAIDMIPGETYRGIGQVATLAVGVQWFTHARQDAGTVYDMTKALFSESAQKALTLGHAKGKFVNVDNATRAAGIPLHPGAERYYREDGILK